MRRQKRLDSLVAIATLLAPGRAAKIARDVTLAIEDPHAYIARNAKRMEERSIDEPFAELPWIALIEGLDRARVLAEIDWKTSGVDLAWNLEQIVGFPKAAVKWLRAVDEIEDERSTLELLEECGERLLAERALQLAHLDMGGDNFCLVVASPSVIDRAAALAKAARYGTIEAFTGAGMKAARREREARQERDRKETAREARRRARQADEWKFFAKGKATWACKVAKLAVDTGFEAPAEKFYRSHYFSDAKRCAARAREIVAAWKREGYKPVDRAAYERIATAKTAYIGWVGPFPEDGRYWVENKKIVRCLTCVGDAVVSVGGVVGKNFAELQTYQHFKSQAVAERELAAAVARHDASPLYKPVTRAELMKRYR